MQSAHSLGKFILASALLHLVLLGATVLMKVKNERLIPVEISFGTGNSRGGSGPKLVVASSKSTQVKRAPVKAQSKVLKSTPKVLTDAPVAVAKTTINDEIKITESAVEKDLSSGSSLGSTSGSGSGTTSGPGKGFNDPKVRYRSIVRELLNSKKHYPRKAQALQQEGTVVAKIKLDKSGKLISVEIVESSPYQILAKATLDVINAIDKFPEIPAEIGLSEYTFNIPFEYEQN